MAFIREGSICCVVDDLTGQAYPTKHKDSEPAFIQTVPLGLVIPRESRPKEVHWWQWQLGSKPKEPMSEHPSRFDTRNPIIGDKFSSRHGQRACWASGRRRYALQQTGMTPDVIINPHAFPSRMTIGMLLESLAARAAHYTESTKSHALFIPRENTAGAS